MTATTKEKSDVKKYVELAQELTALQNRVSQLKRQLREDALDEEIKSEIVNLLLFKVEELNCALALDYALEITPFARLNPLAEARPWVPGALDLRGETIPVIDLSARIFGKPPNPSIGDFIIICKGRSGKVGFVVQNVESVITLSSDEIKNAAVETDHAHYVLGVLNLSGRQIHVLSALRIIDSSDLSEDAA